MPTAKAAAALRAIRHTFKCSPSGSAITAKDNQLFRNPQEIWAAPSFPTFKSCNLSVADNGTGTSSRWSRTRPPS